VRHCWPRWRAAWQRAAAAAALCGAWRRRRGHGGGGGGGGGEQRGGGGGVALDGMRKRRWTCRCGSCGRYILCRLDRDGNRLDTPVLGVDSMPSLCRGGGAPSGWNARRRLAAQTLCVVLGLCGDGFKPAFLL